MGGVWLGHQTGGAAWWLAMASVLAAATLWGVWRGGTGPTRWWAMAAWVAVAAAWSGVRGDSLAADSVARFVTGEPQMARVIGTVAGPPRFSQPPSGEYDRFGHHLQSTTFVLRTEAISVQRVWRETSGKLLVRVREADHRLAAGDRIQVNGWLAPIRGPSNPGEVDYRTHYTRQGIAGQCTLPTGGNWRLLSPAPRLSFRWLRRMASTLAAASLRAGMSESPQRLALLETVLLGRDADGMGALEDHFREVGLAHVLSVSGAHLAILLGLVWLAARRVVARPPWEAVVVLLVLAVYLLIVPPRVPIMRSAVMASLLGVGYITGRAARALDLLALAAVVILIGQPRELFAPGFQLSFGIVAGLLLFTDSVRQRVWPDLFHDDADDPGKRRLMRGLTGYVSANVVASLLALPLVAYHFKLLSPMAVVVSLLAFPLLTGLLAVGYVKIMVGAVVPVLGALLAGPLTWVTDLLIGLVRWLAQCPAAAIYLPTAPSIAVTVAMIAVVVALFAGWFAGRKTALAAAVVLCLLGLYDTYPDAATHALVRPAQPPLRLNMLAVGDGSCYLVRTVDPDTGQGHVLMFDCGSQWYADVGSRVVVPALNHLRVGRIDTLMLSHADLDHFSGSLAVIDQIGVDRVLMTPQMLVAAESLPSSAVARLLAGLRHRGVRYNTISRGWREMCGGAGFEVLWPPADVSPAQSNDASMVLMVRAARRRVMLSGDIQQQAIASLLAGGVDLRADVCDLPHHGSLVEDSPRWLAAVAPRVVLQSSGPGRLRWDKWASLLEGSLIQRLTTSRRGMVELTISTTGEMTWHGFKPQHAP